MGQKRVIAGAQDNGSGRKGSSKKGTRGLAAKIMKWISIPVVLIFLCSGFLLLDRVKSTVTGDLSREELITTTQSAAYQINNFFENYVARVTEASANKTYENIMTDTPPGARMEHSGYYEDAISGLKKAQATDSENILSSWIADFDASELMMSDGFLSDPELDVSTRPWYQVANTKKPLITEPYTDVSTGKLVVTVVAPLYDVGGRYYRCNRRGYCHGAAWHDYEVLQSGRNGTVCPE